MILINEYLKKQNIGDEILKAFGNYHPLTLIIYFISVTSLAMFVWNPVFQLIALVSSVLFSFMLQRKKEVLKDFTFYIPLFLMISITNPLFSHNGVTPLFFLNGNPVTLEAFIYGIAIGVMIIGLMFWFKCYNLIMTSDKFFFLFGKIIPKLSLILSMVLRFVPMFKRQIYKVKQVQKAMGLYSSKSYTDKIKSNMRVFSSLVSWSFENSIETTTSMKARGYGLKGKTNFSLFRFTLKDGFFLTLIIILYSLTLCGVGLKATEFFFYPHISDINYDVFAIFTYISYGLLAFLPFIVEIKESLKWKYYISKI